MSRLHRQKMRQRARLEHSQFDRTPEALAGGVSRPMTGGKGASRANTATAPADDASSPPIVTGNNALTEVKPSRAKRTKRKAVRKAKARGR
jgi:hypothetical protein